jgi:hypothetical protein
LGGYEGFADVSLVVEWRKESVGGLVYLSPRLTQKVVATIRDKKVGFSGADRDHSLDSSRTSLLAEMAAESWAWEEI